MLAARSDYLAALLARAGSLEQPPRQKRSSSSTGLAVSLAARREEEEEQQQQQQQQQQQRQPEQGTGQAGSAQQGQHEGEGDPCRQLRQREASTSGREGQHSSAQGQQQQQQGARPEAAAELPVVAVSGVSAAVFAAVLQHVYMDSVPDLAPGICTDEGAEALFDAADRYLLFTMKVAACSSHMLPREHARACITSFVPACL